MNKEIKELRADVEDLKEEVSLLKGIIPPKMSKEIAQLRCEVEDLRKEVGSLKDTISKQNLTIMELLKEQKDILDSLKRRGYESKDSTGNCVRKFPIDSEEKLQELDMQINDDNLQDYVNTMSILLSNGGLRKHLNEILSRNFVMEVNLRGTNNKAPLITRKRFMDALYKATYTNEECSQGVFLKELRFALKLSKNRMHKLQVTNRKREKMEEENTSQPEVKFEEIYFDDDGDDDDDS